jgi:hypothetical protein|tara:strand:+ start:2851 stop:3237 length:387 start_codon:yes stop_codon:yes gene_type:complete
METSANKLVLVYLKIRNAIKDKDEEIKKLKEQQDTVSDELLKLCESQEADGLKTPSGTVSRRVISSFWTSDWERMYAFIAEHSAPHLLEKRIHNGNMKEFLADNPDVTPEGLQAKNRYAISVRKPTKK